jgi:pimeloyl-ACP methyl ester carboxylesterase
MTMRRGYADTRLGQLHTTTWGEASNAGLPIVLLPQSANSAAMYWNLAARLEADFRLVAIDYPGSGWSDPMPEEITFGAIGAAFLDVLDRLEIRQCVLYGHHTGNKIAAAMAAAYPDRIAQLIFVGQSHSIVASNSQRSGTVGKMRRKLLESSDTREAALVQWTDLFNRFNGKWWDEALVRDLGNDARRAATIRKVSDELLSGQSMPALYRANFAHDLEADLRRIEAPTLVIEIASPSEDRTVGRQGDHLKQLMKRATIAVLEEPDRPANTMEHRADDLARLVREFLKGPPR